MQSFLLYKYSMNKLKSRKCTWNCVCVSIRTICGCLFNRWNIQHRHRLYSLSYIFMWIFQWFFGFGPIRSWSNKEYIVGCGAFGMSGKVNSAVSIAKYEKKTWKQVFLLRIFCSRAYWKKKTHPNSTTACVCVCAHRMLDVRSFMSRRTWKTEWQKLKNIDKITTQKDNHLSLLHTHTHTHTMQTLTHVSVRRQICNVTRQNDRRNAFHPNIFIWRSYLFCINV